MGSARASAGLAAFGLAKYLDAKDHNGDLSRIDGVKLKVDAILIVYDILKLGATTTDGQLGSMDGQLSSMDGRLGVIDIRLNTIDGKSSRLEGKL